MKKLAALLLAAAGIALGSSSAWADFFAISADLPVSYTADDTAADSVTGYKIGLSLPFFVGVAMENYTGTFNGSGSEPDVKVTNNLYDVFFNLPLPILNIGLGLGTGTASIDTGSTSYWKDATLTQYFLTVGLPILVLFDVHVGYHVISGSADPKPGLGAPKISLDGNMVSVGAKVGF
ncbi:MAG: hypothetical protein HY342_05795 [Candidatus Lambdaproteobacteria bacterium]|nr:hypothetical protein [Candidatus Lambdaproteobacteria bacterium]